ncbi:MAG: hypothetical protein QOH12_93 [Solirubrobacteraceae bacterium]|nr:hypothetical protein [Solirubrobacteraceae bacterium]
MSPGSGPACIGNRGHGGRRPITLFRPGGQRPPEDATDRRASLDEFRWGSLPPNWVAVWISPVHEPQPTLPCRPAVRVAGSDAIPRIVPGGGERQSLALRLRSPGQLVTPGVSLGGRRLADLAGARMRRALLGHRSGRRRGPSGESYTAEPLRARRALLGPGLAGTTKIVYVAARSLLPGSAPTTPIFRRSATASSRPRCECPSKVLARRKQLSRRCKPTPSLPSENPFEPRRRHAEWPRPPGFRSGRPGTGRSRDRPILPVVPEDGLTVGEMPHLGDGADRDRAGPTAGNRPPGTSQTIHRPAPLIRR